MLFLWRYITYVIKWPCLIGRCDLKLSNEHDWLMVAMKSVGKHGNHKILPKYVHSEIWVCLHWDYILSALAINTARDNGTLTASDIMRLYQPWCCINLAWGSINCCFCDFPLVVLLILWPRQKTQRTVNIAVRFSLLFLKLPWIICLKWQRQSLGRT